MDPYIEKIRRNLFLISSIILTIVYLKLSIEEINLPFIDLSTSHDKQLLNSRMKLILTAVLIYNLLHFISYSVLVLKKIPKTIGNYGYYFSSTYIEQKKSFFRYVVFLFIKLIEILLTSLSPKFMDVIFPIFLSFFALLSYYLTLGIIEILIYSALYTLITFFCLLRYHSFTTK